MGWFRLPPAKFRLGDLLDYFIPAEMQVNAESHRRARMFMLSHAFGPILGNSIPLYMAVTGISRDYRVVVFFLSIAPLAWRFDIVGAAVALVLGNAVNVGVMLVQLRGEHRRVRVKA